MGTAPLLPDFLSEPPRDLTPRQRRTLLLAAVVMEHGADAVPDGQGHPGEEDELGIAHAMARRLSAVLADPAQRAQAADALRAAALTGTV